MEKEEKIAEFIGIMLGDGCIGICDCKCGNKIKKQYQLKVTLDSRNVQYLEYVANIFSEVLGVKPVIFFKKNENTVDIRTFKKEKIDYAINSLGLKISPKFQSAEIPGKYCNGKLGLFVLRGLFDTDGCVTIFNNNGIRYPRLELRLCDSPMQNQIINILTKNLFNFKIQKLDNGEIKIRISGLNGLKKWNNEIKSSNQLYLDKINSFLRKGL